jgi:hypothetical protein
MVMFADTGGSELDSVIHDYPAPLDDIKQEYAQPDRPANPWNTFKGFARIRALNPVS